MTVTPADMVRVFLASRKVREQEKLPDLISLVFPYRGMTCQVFLEWKRDKMMKDYILDPRIGQYFSLHMAYHSRLVDQRGLRQRLTYMPKPNDELRFLTVRAGVV